MNNVLPLRSRKKCYNCEKQLPGFAEDEKEFCSYNCATAKPDKELQEDIHPFLQSLYGQRNSLWTYKPLAEVIPFPEKK